MSAETFKLSLNRKKVVRNIFLFLLAIEIIVVVLDLTITHGRLIELKPIRRFLNMTKEESVGTWVSVMLFFFISLQCLIIFYFKDMHKTWMRRYDWLVFSVFFSYLSMDDAARMHERLGTSFSIYAKSLKKAGDEGLIVWLHSNFPSYYWQLIYGPFLILLGGAFFLKLWFDYRDNFLRTLLVAGYGILAFSQALDYFEGLGSGYQTVRAIFDVNKTTGGHFQKVIEEFLEMFGMTLVLISLTSHFLRKTEKIEIKVEN